MTDAEYQKEKKRIQKLIEKWKDCLGLGWWRVAFEYERVEDSGTDNVDYRPQDVGGYWKNVATTRCDPFYLKATIVFYLLQTKELNDEDLEQTFVHECMHILLSPMRTKEKADFEEMVATKLAQAFIWTYK